MIDFNHFFLELRIILKLIKIFQIVLDISIPQRLYFNKDKPGKQNMELVFNAT